MVSFLKHGRGHWLGGQRSVAAARDLNRAAGLLALSVLLDSGLEHYRGSFRNKAMFTPLVVSSLAVAVSAHGMRDRHASTHRVRDGVYLISALTGIVGNGFHLYNVLKRPGGVRWQNLFYGAPLGAPFAIALSGALGRAGEKIREHAIHTPRRVWGVPPGRGLAALTSVGMLGTVGEAGLLHFRGAFHNPAMFLPVSLPVVASGLLAKVSVGGSRGLRRVTRGWMILTAIMGFAGVGFHARGVSRNMGGWRNWRQTLMNGPPLPAPPSFTALALAGIAALDLLEERR